MKKVILSAIAVFAFGLANAQGVEFGVKGGLNVANTNQTITSGITKNPILGVNVGFFADVKITPKFSVQPEILFSMQGTELSASGGGFKTTGTSTINYINIPVMAKFFVAPKLSLQVGPQAGFVVAATDKLVTNVPGFASYNNDAKSDYNSVDFGLNFGVGFDISKKILIDLRYNLGLTAINKNPISGQSDIKNNVFSLNVGYKFL